MFNTHFVKIQMHVLRMLHVFLYSKKKPTEPQRHPRLLCITVKI